MLVILFITSCGGAVGTAAQARVPNTTSGSQTQPTSVDLLRDEVADLRKKVEKPPKDVWDKLTALSGVISGIMVALIGFYATNVYNRRQQAIAERRKDQELLISQIQTVEKFIPHLSSGDEQKKRAALISIAALGNADLAIKLADAFRGTGATSALTSIASTAGPETAKRAEQALGDVLNYLRARIVTVHAGDSRLATGFVVSPKGLIVTTAHAITEFPSHERLLDNLRVRLPTDDLVPARTVKIDDTKDLALLETSTERILTPLDLSPSTPILGDNVTAVLVDLAGQIQVQLGTVSGLVTLASGGERIAVSLKIEPGASGTPVVDKEGRLLGLVQSRDMKGTTYLTPAAQILDFIGTKQI